MMSADSRDIHVPRDPSNLGGPFVIGKAMVVRQKEGRGIAVLSDLSEDLEWLEPFEHVHFQTLKDGKTLKGIRKATQDDFKRYRVPVWIQDEETPTCCGQPMAFVGQLDDDLIHAEPPAEAKMWWHDRASFYVFTCAQCLGVKAVGQQF
jgi:hypothetical protein